MSLRLFAVIAALAAVAPAGAAEEAVTFNKHVAPILFKQCASCHRPGEVAPFSLLTYKDAAKRADQLAEVTKKRVMPPWKAEPGHGEFRDERRLTDAEVGVVAAWAAAKAPEGDPKDLPPAPKFAAGWPLGEPDLVVKMPNPVDVPADGRDQIRRVPLPVTWPGDSAIAAVDFRPGNRAVVHHALVLVDNVGLMRDNAAKDAPKQPGGRAGNLAGLLQSKNGVEPFALLGAWVPGSTPKRLPDGFGMKVNKDSRLVLQMHYHPVGKAATDQSEVAVYFAKKPDAKPITTLTLAGLPVSIPAGEKRHRITAGVTLPTDVTVYSIGPHMHQLGKEMKVTATLPDGKTKPLVWIKEWDWNWQGGYAYKEPVTLPKGTRIDLEAFYDNSADNPTNPNSPPKAVRWGEQTTDEMCLCFMQVSVATDQDAAALRLAMIMQMIPRKVGLRPNEK